MMGTVTEEMCNFCKTVSKKYTCPRCNADYCSLICFQSPTHIDCAESFYHSCVVENLQSVSKDDDSEQKMTEVFNRLREQYESSFHENNDEHNDTLDSDDDADYSSLAERLANVDLDDTKEVWKRLTSDERQEFEAFLRSGDVSKFVPKWQPWWLQEKPSKIVEIDNEVLSYKENCPKVLDNINKFDCLTHQTPSPCVRHNLANIICAYAFTTRYFNGDYYEFIGEAVGCTVYLSLCLKENKNYNSFDEAVKSVQEECLKNEWISVDQENINTMKEDVTLILQGYSPIEKNYYTLSALSDLHKLISSFLKKDGHELNTFLQNCPTYKLPKKNLKLYLKKLEYFLSYTLYYVTNP